MKLTDLNYVREEVPELYDCVSLDKVVYKYEKDYEVTELLVLVYWYIAMDDSVSYDKKVLKRLETKLSNGPLRTYLKRLKTYTLRTTLLKALRKYLYRNTGVREFLLFTDARTSLENSLTNPTKEELTKIKYDVLKADPQACLLVVILDEITTIYDDQDIKNIANLVELYETAYSKMTGDQATFIRTKLDELLK